MTSNKQLCERGRGREREREREREGGRERERDRGEESTKNIMVPLKWKWYQVLVHEKSEEKIMNIFDRFWSTEIQHNDPRLGSVQTQKHIHISVIRGIISPDTNPPSINHAAHLLSSPVWLAKRRTPHDAAGVCFRAAAGTTLRMSLLPRPTNERLTSLGNMIHPPKIQHKKLNIQTKVEGLKHDRQY